jgi:hypothetical protein
MMKKHLHVSGIPWPVQSPGFTVLGLFLWGNLEKNAYIGIAHTQYRSWNVLFRMKLQP